jgi:hypothetical protein
MPGDLYLDKNKPGKPVTLSLNGKPVKYEMKQGYAVINRVWNNGDKIQLDLPMDNEKIIASDSIAADRSRFALQRGPVVYCLEGPDNMDAAVMNIVVDKNAPVNASYKPSLLNGVTVLEMKGRSTKRQLNSDKLIESQQTVTAIPYYAWANRGPSEMEVWIPFVASAARPKPAPTIASKSKADGSVNNQRMLRALNDQYDPQDSKDGSASYLHWWPKKNTTEWVQYDFDSSYTVSESRVYWFDDGPWGGCRIPVSWKLYYRKDGQWVPVKNQSSYEISKDKFNSVKFEPVTTTAMKLEVQLPADYATGIHEWSIK